MKERHEQTDMTLQTIKCHKMGLLSVWGKGQTVICQEENDQRLFYKELKKNGNIRG